MTWRGELTFIRKVSPRPMPEESRLVAEDLLAKFVARCFVEDNPQLFRPRTSRQNQNPQSGPSEARREDR